MTLAEIILSCITSGCISATVIVVINAIKEKKEIKKAKADFDKKVNDEVRKKAKHEMKNRVWMMCTNCRFHRFVDEHPKEYMEFCVEEDRREIERMEKITSMTNKRYCEMLAKREISRETDEAVEREVSYIDPDTE